MYIPLLLETQLITASPTTAVGQGSFLEISGPCSRQPLVPLVGFCVFHGMLGMGLSVC